ncbi:hypothetical protein [Aquisalinus flavus]|uniref:Lipoprotein n=1 Tax=Aquisalinus flavus TaxID=1526572 RepID=A0A8J2V3K7_9PROT|nr:hypothetical protein [Aquisalinus flavus]MBD0425297.1 hypothetical protein [Aquisalinus flavus]UNE49050.1 hypothetical protein FF099_13810 [Aquisalinus flavus]GGD17187.1 hypothetical protein GCM10011342_27470 [Aquisalinus flavus]
MKKSVFGAALAAGASFLLAGTAGAQQDGQTPPPAKFTAQQAASCAATFDWMLEFVDLDQATGMSEQDIKRFYMETDIAAAMWTYELYAAMDGKTDDELKAAYIAGAESLLESFPEDDTEEAGQQVVNTVMAKAEECGTTIAQAYPDGNHPVIQQMMAQAAAAQQQQQQQEAPAAE